MEDPKTPETLKSESPSEDISGLPDLSGGLTVEIQVAENGVAASACTNEAEIGDVEWRNEEDEKGMHGFEGEVLDGGVVFVAGTEEDGGNGGGAEDEQNKGNAVEFDASSTAKNMEAHGDGISLTVDFLNFQPEELELSKSTGIDEMLKEARDEKQVIENGNDYNFSVGDVIWVKTKSQTWWPGKIYPSDAAESDESSRSSNGLLVGYLGSSHMTWCSPSQLIPFAENFEQLSGKYKSRSFLGAVEKAVDEFGRCVRLEMICSCIPEGNHPEGDDGSKDATSLPRYKSSFLTKYSVDQYETETFLARVKDLAQIVSRCGTLESSILYNQLAAFQSSIGHLQLPLHQLLETHDAEENVVGRSARKSKARVNVKNDEEQVEGGTQGSPSETLSIRSDVQREKIEEMNRDPNKIIDGSMEGSKRSCRRKAIANGGIESRSVKRKRSEKFEDLESSKMNSSIKEGKDSGVGDFDDGSKGISEKRTEMRERKKSKYLSFPYINWGLKGMSPETEEIKALKISGEDENENAVEGENETPLLLKCSGKFWKKWYRNITSGSDVADIQELMSASPAEFLSELHFTAVNCLYPNENNNFDAVAQFFSRFRIFMFHDESVNTGQNEAMAADLFFLGGKVSEVKHLSSSSAKSGIKKRRGQASSNTKMEEKKSELISDDVGLIGNAEICPTGDAQKKTPMSCNVKSKKDGESLGRLKTKSLSSLSDVNISLSSISPLTKDPPEIGPGPLTPSGVPKRSKRKINGSHPQSKPTTEVPNLNGSGLVPGSLGEDQQTVSQAASQQKSEPKKRRKLGVAKEHSKVSTEFIDVNNSNKPGSFFIDIQVTAQQPVSVIPEKDRVDFAGSINPSTKNLTIAQDQSKSVIKRRKRKENPPLADSKVILSTDIPDLNGMGIESGQGKDSQSKPKRRRRRKGEAGLNHPNPSDRPYIYNKVKTDGEGLGSLLLLTFSSEAPLPPREQVITTFSQFGSLKESEILLKDSTVEIVFLRSVDAKEAVRSLKKNNIFGPTLLKYQLYHLSAPPKMSDSDRACTALAYPASEGTLNPSKSTELESQAGEAPPIEFIRRNLQMMTSMLEKSGDNLSPDMRAKLETDVECLLKKVSSMAGSSLT